MKLQITFIAIVLSVSAGVSLAEDKKPDAKKLAFFESKIRPVLAQHCYKCHSLKSGKSESSLTLDTRGGIRQGGVRGPAVVAGQPKKSLLLDAIAHRQADLRMPPKADKFAKSVVQDFEKWIRDGAIDPRQAARSAKPATNTADRHWSLLPIRKTQLPKTENKKWAARDLDHFVLARLEKAKLKPNDDARPAILLRRLYFDLIGLPPTAEEMRSFIKRITEKGLDKAIEEVADRLIDSRHFGERWGRHWLDVVRFGESSGKEANISFPYAWRYRDYVIDSFNDDVPYNRFLTEQIAGDLLPYAHNTERARLMIATAFLAMGPKNLDEANRRQFQADVVDEQIDAVSRAFLASSIACARCHDHKFDPFSMDDYYALAGIFSSSKTYFGTHVSPSNRVGGDPLRLPEVEGQVVLHRSIGAKKVAVLKARLAAFKKEEKEGRAAVRKAIREGKDPSGIFTLRDALRIFWGSGGINGQLKRVDDEGRALPLTMGVLDRESIGDARMLVGGDVRRPGKTVSRGFPTAIRVPNVKPPATDHSGRLELAHWLTSPSNPLTSRVIVNRAWHHLFGSGLVRTMDNFGTTGEEPSHPQLLDYLAARFITECWSIKKLVRTLVTSRTYRQSSAFRQQAFAADPENRLRWRATKRRLDAEVIRDAMLTISGELDRKRPVGSLVGRVIGDRPISLIGLDKRVPKDLDGSLHRSVYLPVIRDRLPDVLELFDFAEPSLVTGARETTNVPAQALYLMNNQFVLDRAKALADRVGRQSKDRTTQIRFAFQLCFNRLPDQAEIQLAKAFFEGDDGRQKPPLESFCHALLATSEFRLLD